MESVSRLIQQILRKNNNNNKKKHLIVQIIVWHVRIQTFVLNARNYISLNKACAFLRTLLFPKHVVLNVRFARKDFA